MSILTLLRNYSLSWYRYNWKTGLLAFIAASLGVAIFSAVKLSSLMLLAGVERSEQALAGGATLQVRSADGRVDPQVIPKLRKLPEIRSISPRLNQLLPTEGDELRSGVELVGFDFFQVQRVADSQDQPEFDRKELLEFVKNYRTGLLVTGETTADPKTVSVLVNGELKTVQLKPSAELKKAFDLQILGSYLLMDISAAQDLLGEYQRIDLLDLHTAKNVSLPEVIRKITKELSPGHRVVELSDYIEDQNNLTEAFRLNLEFLSAVSLPVGILTIYSVLSFLSLKRVKDLTLLRVLGMSQPALLRLLLLEAVAFGLLSAFFGALFGLLIAQAMYAKFSMTSQALYGTQPSSAFSLPAGFLLTALGAGIAVSLAGFILPILEALRGSLRSGLYGAGSVLTKPYLRCSFIAIGVLVLAVLSSTRAFLNLGRFAGLFSPVLIIVGVSLFAPIFLHVIVKLITPLTTSFPTVQLAVNHLRLSTSRNYVTVGALGVSFGLVLAISIFLESFKRSVSSWIVAVTPADLYISAPSAFANKQSAALPNGVLEWSRAHTAVKDVDFVYDHQYTLNGRTFTINAVRFEVLKARKGALLVAGRFPEAGEIATTALISEAFQRKFGLTIGQKLSLELSGRSLQSEVLGVLKDYTNEQGVVYLDEQAIDTTVRPPSAISIFLNSADPQLQKQFSEELGDAFPNTQLIVRSAEELRSFVLQVFDRTFGVTWILQFIALLIAVLNLISIVLLMFVERSREFAILKALGAPSTMIVRSICVETAILGCSGALAAALQGVLLGCSLVLAINPHFFGWTIDLSLNYTKVILLLLSIVVIATVSGMVSRLLISKIDAGKLRYA